MKTAEPYSAGERVVGRPGQPARCTIIIGGGITGIATFVSLVKHRATPSIVIIDPAPAGVGKAFATTSHELLCNTSVGTMSLIASNTRDFQTYLHRRGFDATLNDFVPRFQVSSYARELYQAYSRQALDYGISHHHVRGTATSIHRDMHGGYRVILEDGNVICGTEVLVCMGLGAPVVPELMREYIGAARFFETPYPEQALLDALEPRSKVLVVGTRLSAIDAALLLCGRGHRVVMTSRSGELPAVRTRTPRLFPASVDEKMVAELDPSDPLLRRKLIVLLCRSAASVKFRSLSRQVVRIADPVSRLRAEAELAAADVTDWQDILVSSLEAGNAYLSKQPGSARGKVLDACIDFVQRYLFAIPLENARKLLNFLDGGQLRIVPGAPIRLDRQATWMATWAQSTPVSFDAVVCAAGFQKPQFHAGHDRLELVTGISRRCVAPHVSAALQVTLPESATPERIWTLGVASYLGAPLVNAVFQAVQQADFVARLLAVKQAELTTPQCHGQEADESLPLADLQDA